MRELQLLDKNIGDNHPCYIIAEIGNQFKTFEEGKRLIDSAIKIGVDAVKFQTWDAETLTTKNNYFNMEATGYVSQYEIHKQNQISQELQLQVVEYCKKIGITIFSAPSHIEDLNLMEKMEIPIYKIGSDLACHTPLLKLVAKKNKPIILSTGMCTIEEIRNSVDAILSEGNDQIALLHCVSDYPTKIEEANLNAIQTLKKEFDFPVGYSDHTLDVAIPFAATAMGACIIEKHFKHPLNSPCPDDAHAADPDQMKWLVDSIRQFETAKGNGVKAPTTAEKRNLPTNRVSIIAMKDIQKGETITKDMLDIRRPGSGIQPIHFDKIIGKIAKQDVKKEEPLKSEHVEW